ncbi:GDP-fucose protein O-fucosyltransferase 2 [Blattella germanica]|nr:GDP-fucose protein O-fucosyltransferase 2 [Blattella germanica]
MMFHLFILITCVSITFQSQGFCSKDGDDIECEETRTFPKYILYDVNPPEGFNLRRDVYMRMAVFARSLRRKAGDWHLVLPPWGHLYHWQSQDVGLQELLPWSLFFNVSSLQQFAPVIEMHEFLKEVGKTRLDMVYILQHFKDAFEDGKWEEKFEVESCHEKNNYERVNGGYFRGPFWGYGNITAKEVHCLSFHGHASQLQDVLKDLKVHTIMFDHAEVALHDRFGDAIYWKARRSMRFSSVLVKLAANFRAEYLNSTDKTDGTMRPDDWTKETARSDTLGGPYLCAHMRRKDFLWGRPKQIPSLEGAALQIRNHLERLKLTTAFIATDAPATEFEKLQKLLPEYQILRYRPSEIVRQSYKDGGIAIIDQIICSHARYFIGTHESTFTFRIQEEREIMGFDSLTTFNRLCGDNEKKCSKPSVWRIVF